MKAIPGSMAHSLRRLLTTLPVLLILLATLLAATGETLHSRLLAVGADQWPDYFRLRLADQVQAPQCDPQADVERQVEAAMARSSDGNDPFADVFGDQPDAESIHQSVTASITRCQESWRAYRMTRDNLTWDVRLFSQVEIGLSQAVVLVTNNRRTLLCLLLLFCAAAATLGRQHIALRPVESPLDDRVATGAQLLANILLTLSAWLYRQQELAQAAAGMPLAHLYIHDFWVAGFGALALISLIQLLLPAKGASSNQGLGRALLSIPLYSMMCLAAAAQFAFYGFYHGIAVYLNMMAELSALFLNLGLYVWVGMLLGRSQLPERVFDLLRPLDLPPKILGILVLALTALPTAYTGASGIFILAAGLTLYRELRKAGTSEQLALAITAISGSMGTMLRPCLLVVIVATLNNSVTTDELFGAGARVLLLTLSVFTVVVFVLGGREPMRMAPLGQAMPAMARAAWRLVPYILIFLTVVAIWSLGLDRRLDEFSAPAMLPFIMLAILLYERFALARRAESRPSFRSHIVAATDDSTALIGALLMLMALSVSMGGLIERSGLLGLFPDQVGSIWLSVAMLTAVLVFIGMIMDPYGAVLLVNATLAPIALDQGLHPLHFWTLTILAFEMGYLTPPVALNHLLTRQVVGMPTSPESLAGTFWQRNFRIILPIIVMGIALLTVAFLPIASESVAAVLLGTGG